MSEVWKSIYGCFKKKNCTECNCCTTPTVRSQKEPKTERERRKAEKAARKKYKDAKAVKEAQAKAEAAIKGKTHEEKEKILGDLAKAGKPLPVGRTFSERKLIEQIKACMWLKHFVPTKISDECYTDGYKAFIIQS